MRCSTPSLTSTTCDDDPLVAAAAQAPARAGMFRGSFSSRSRDLDLLYRDNDIDAAEGFIVVEAKGGSARLGDKEIAPGTPRAWQGTVAYLDKTIEEMVARGDAPWAAQLQHALRGGSVRYLAVMAPYRNATPDARDPNRKRTLLSATLRIQRFL